jgi:hypothetical protein
VKTEPLPHRYTAGRRIANIGFIENRDYKITRTFFKTLLGSGSRKQPLRTACHRGRFQFASLTSSPRRITLEQAQQAAAANPMAREIGTGMMRIAS